MKDVTVLIVDDMQCDRKLLSGMLARKLGCHIIEATCGEDAMKILTDQKVDIVLLDIEMPNMTGNEVITLIRKNSSLAELPIIMVSSLAHDSSIIKSIKLGANDYITKPVDFEIASARILNQLKLSKSILDRAKFQEIAALKAMVITYNHEINNPLTIALASFAQLKKNPLDEISFKRVETALLSITEIVKKISHVLDKEEVSYENYQGEKKMVKIK